MHIKEKRNGCIDIWNAFMVAGATFDHYDIPFCPTTATEIPADLISYADAMTIYHKEMSLGHKDFFFDSFIHAYIDDQKFDGKNVGVWNKPFDALKMFKHFAGVITFDFSTYIDFPNPLKIWNTYRMRALGYWLTQNGIKVINNVRWGNEDTWDFSFSGLPDNSMYFIGVAGSGLKSLENRHTFDTGLMEFVRRKDPQTLLIYGSDKYHIFSQIRDLGINVISYKGDTCRAYEGRRLYE